MKTSEFDFDLPPDLIAQAPLPERSLSRMMVVHRESRALEHRRILDLPDYLCRGDLLVLNDTRVFPARLHGRWRDTGGHVEVLLLEEEAPDTWVAMFRASRRQRKGGAVDFGDGRLTGRIEDERPQGRVLIALSAGGNVRDAIEDIGVPPVPPYIKRPLEDERLVRLDRLRYQTVYARAAGAVAAPTAGLHFTQDLLDAIEAQGVDRVHLTLHVGPGTFRPVTAEQVEDHAMEAERYKVSPAAAVAINRTKAAGGRVIAVGSTSVRALETVAAEHGRVVPCEGRTSLFIRPPYPFRIVDVMLTNFHLPKSTLIMMVSALAGVRDGEDWQRGLSLVMTAYAEAVREKYRFYSYGDCMLIV